MNNIKKILGGLLVVSASASASAQTDVPVLGDLLAGLSGLTELGGGGMPAAPELPGLDGLLSAFPGAPGDMPALPGLDALPFPTIRLTLNDQEVVIDGPEDIVTVLTGLPDMLPGAPGDMPAFPAGPEDLIAALTGLGDMMPSPELP